MPSIQLRLEGNHTDELAQSLQHYIASEWDIQTTVKQAEIQSQPIWHDLTF